jgi:hypothetical protein
LYSALLSVLVNLILFKFYTWKIPDAGVGKSGRAGGKAPLRLEEFVYPKDRTGLKAACPDGSLYANFRL